jgi:hypothetical protein
VPEHLDRPSVRVREELERRSGYADGRLDADFSHLPLDLSLGLQSTQKKP